MKTASAVIWQPFDRAAYRLDDTLSEEGSRAISTAHGRALYQQSRPVTPLLQPLVDIARRSELSRQIVLVNIQAVLARLNIPCHRWTAERWQATYQHRRLSGALLASFDFDLSGCATPAAGRAQSATAMLCPRLNWPGYWSAGMTAFAGAVGQHGLCTPHAGDVPSAVLSLLNTRPE